MSSAKLVALTSSDLELRVAPEAGARVVALIDRQTGRNWLAEGRLPGADQMTYGLAEAAGWDECFPTVSPCDARTTPWLRVFRDHGDLWGRPATVTTQSVNVLETTFEREGFRFVRRLGLAGLVVEIDYGVEARLGEATPFLWAMHPLFTLRPGECIRLEGARSLSPTYLALKGERLDLTAMLWPSAGGRIPFALDRVQGASARFAGKFFAEDGAVRRASIGGPERWLDVEWDGVDHCGLWLTYGAWPEFNDIVHVAIEPTTSPDDTLMQAIAKGRAAFVAPGERKTWRVRLTLRGRL
jgi:galactose mutarotase-like enzyme